MLSSSKANLVGLSFLDLHETAKESISAVNLNKKRRNEQKNKLSDWSLKVGVTLYRTLLLKKNKDKLYN